MTSKLLFIIFMLAAPVFAQTVMVESLQDFSTREPSSELTVRLHDNVYIDEELVFPQGISVTGLVYDVKDPKRLKRNARFSFVPQYYVNGNSETIYIKQQYRAKYTIKLDKGWLAKKAVLIAANKFIFTGFSAVATAAEGAVRNEQGNRVKSSIRALYESSPLSYVEKGHDLEISEGNIFMLNFKKKDID